MAARNTQYIEDLTESTTTSTTYQDKATIIFTPDDNGKYLILASCLITVDIAGPGRSTFVKVTRTTGTAKDFQTIIAGVNVANSYQSVGLMGIDTFGTSPGSQTYKVQYKSEGNGATAKIKDARFFIIKLTSNDQAAESLTRATTTSTVYQDSASLTFTPGTQGDYIIIAMATTDVAGNALNAQAVLDVDGTESDFGENAFKKHSAERQIWVALKKTNLTVASHTIKIKYRTTIGGFTAGIQDARVVVLSASDFDNLYAASNRTRATTTSSSYQDFTTLTQTPSALSHLILMSGKRDVSTTGSVGGAKFIKDSTAYTEELEAYETASPDVSDFLVVRETLSAASTTWKTQYKSNGTATVGFDESEIVVFQLEATAVSTIPNKIVSINQAVRRAAYW